MSQATADAQPHSGRAETEALPEQPRPGVAEDANEASPLQQARRHQPRSTADASRHHRSRRAAGRPRFARLWPVATGPGDRIGLAHQLGPPWRLRGERTGLRATGRRADRRPRVPRRRNTVPASPAPARAQAPPTPSVRGDQTPRPRSPRRPATAVDRIQPASNRAQALAHRSWRLSPPPQRQNCPPIAGPCRLDQVARPTSSDALPRV